VLAAGPGTPPDTMVDDVDNRPAAVPERRPATPTDERGSLPERPGAWPTPPVAG
jgi:hypothetical protein